MEGIVIAEEAVDNAALSIDMLDTFVNLDIRKSQYSSNRLSRTE
jgi:hypothetical protein